MAGFSDWARSLGTGSPDESAVGNIVPLARHQDGTLTFAVPEMLRSMVRGLGDANDLKATPDSVNLALAAGVGGGALAPVEREAGQTVMGTFAGRKSANADQSLADKATSMAIDDNSSNSDILNKTGWFIGSDGHPRYEIPDQEQTLKLPFSKHPDMALPQTQAMQDKTSAPIPEGWNVGPSPGYQQVPMGSNYTLGDIMDHPELFAAYPQLKGIPVKSTGFNFNIRGGYGRDPQPTIYLGSANPTELNSTLHHEVQHAIQHIEGFTNGGNPSEFKPEGFDDAATSHKQDAEGWRKQQTEAGVNPYSVQSAAKFLAAGNVPDYIQKSYAPEIAYLQDLRPGEQAALQQHWADTENINQIGRGIHDQYSKLAGEVEARNVQTRLGHDPANNNPPWETEDIPIEKQLVWNGKELELPTGEPVPKIDPKLSEILKNLGKPSVK